MIKFFDAHTHAAFPAYDLDRDAVMRRAKEARVKMITVGTQTSSSWAALELAHEYPEDVWATVGFHPSHAVVGSPDATAGANSGKAGIWHHDKNEQKEAVPEKFDIEKLGDLAMDSKVVAIGECGLDYYHMNTKHITQDIAERARERQKDVFIQQIELAHRVQKPLMIHCRSAFPDLISILNAERSTLNAVAPGAIHFFSGTLDEARVLADMGFAFTFGGVITFPPKAGQPRADSRDHDEVIKFLPMDRILSETDAPYVTPEPYRSTPLESRRLPTGQARNEPAYVVEVVKKLAGIKNISTGEMASTIRANAKRIFGI